jgi:hypothetical protein
MAVLISWRVLMMKTRDRLSAPNNCEEDTFSDGLVSRFLRADNQSARTTSV